MKTQTSDLIKNTLKLAYKFMEDSEFVSIDEPQIKVVARKIMQVYPKSEIGYPKSEIGYPKWMKEDLAPLEKDYVFLVYELIAGAINYNYWYGKSDIKPSGSGSTLMYEILDKCFESANLTYTNCKTICENAAENFIKQIIFNRLPSIENRIKHIKEIINIIKKSEFIPYVIKGMDHGSISLDNFLHMVIFDCPGYAGDLFLKRAFLLAIMLYRRINWFADEIYKLPVPIDYQIHRLYH